MPHRQHVNLLRSVAATAMPGQPSALRARMRLEALALAERENLGEVAWSYRIVALDQPVTETLKVDGETLHAPWLLPASGQLTALACASCTVGPALEARVTELFAQKRASLGLALDALGNELLFAGSRLVQDRMLADARRQGLNLSGELRPGDPGLGLDAHAAVLRLAQAESIGVTLHHGHTLLPLKSFSVVMGAGIELPKANWFSVAKFPQASFQSTAVKSLGAGKFQIAGKLTIKGNTKDLDFPVTLTQSAGITTASGQFAIKRLPFKIGENEWADTSMVADEVQVKFKVVLSGVNKI